MKKVYLSEDGRSVFKLNDAGYYATWLEYLNSLAIHNLLFPATAYEVEGFYRKEDRLFVLVKQVYVRADAGANLYAIRIILAANGFENIRRQDYYNKELGLLLEDMHDENVLQQGDTLFFIDTVFYIAGKDFHY